MWSSRDEIIRHDSKSRAGKVETWLGLSNRTRQVCSALRARKFLEANGWEAVSKTPRALPLSGSSTLRFPADNGGDIRRDSRSSFRVCGRCRSPGLRFGGTGRIVHYARPPSGE